MSPVVAEEVTEADPFDAVVDTVGGDITLAAIRALKDGGTIASTAFVPEGANGDGRVRLVNVMSGDDHEMLQKLADAAGRGDLHLPIARTFPLEELGAAYDFLATRPEGKIVITR
ncbi:zinc-binding dehydrogenase [Rhizobium sp. IBUN]|uniref:zinc-binding dehydrogenase n=1 Tax=Rhizobium sp. IBUN TaxID=1042326 RepID=UPI0009FEB6C4|nr:zinc-binding dehydrogenase [Rhizobium sp. IBUN]